MALDLTYKTYHEKCFNNVERDQRKPYDLFIKEEIGSFYDEIAEIEYYPHWIDFIRKFIDWNKTDSGKIFRGHSNKSDFYNFKFWQVESSLNRNEPNIPLQEYLQKLKDLKVVLPRYQAFKKIDSDVTLSSLEVLAYLQHKELATPLIDFTYDPITALYFAVVDLPYEPTNGKPDNRLISVLEVDIQLLKALQIKELADDPDYSVLFHSNKPFTDSSVITGLYLHPDYERIKNINLKKQDGLFLFFFSESASYYNPEHSISSLEDYLKHKLTMKGEFAKPIRLHLIPYESIYFPFEEDESPYRKEVILLALAMKGKIGLELFEDIFGVKRDLSVGNGNLVKCYLNNFKNCDCEKIKLTRKLLCNNI